MSSKSKVKKAKVKKRQSSSKVVTANIDEVHRVHDNNDGTLGVRLSSGHSDVILTLSKQLAEKLADQLTSVLKGHYIAP